MPRRTAAQIAASKRNLEKARAARASKAPAKKAPARKLSPEEALKKQIRETEKAIKNGTYGELIDSMTKAPVKKPGKKASELANGRSKASSMQKEMMKGVRKVRRAQKGLGTK